jgi:hypothetical protein
MTTQTRKDLIRTAASLTAYAVIGIGVALVAWGCLAAVVAVAHVVSGN